MKHKVSELEGALLDAAVAKANGWEARVVSDPDCVIRGGEAFVNYVDEDGVGHVSPDEWFPSQEWRDGGPIIERERIDIEWEQEGLWSACVNDPNPMSDKGWWPNEYGPTPLIAAMRAYVSSRFGEEVEL